MFGKAMSDKTRVVRGGRTIATMRYEFIINISNNNKIMTHGKITYNYNRVVFEHNGKMCQFVIWDFDTFNEREKKDCLEQLSLIIGLGGDLQQIERHMKLNGYECTLEDVFLSND